MSDAWASRLARLDGAVDNQFAERLRVLPHAPAAGEYSAAGADPDRPEFEVSGRLHLGGRSEGDLGGDGTRMWATKLLFGQAMAEITKSRLPAGFAFRKDDRIEALDRGELYVVETADPYEEGLIVLKLSRAT